MARRFPNFFERAALSLDYRPPAGSELPNLTAEQSDFPRHERDDLPIGGGSPALWANGVPVFSEDPSFAFSLEAAEGGSGLDVEPQPVEDLLEFLERSPRPVRWATDWVAAYASWHLHGIGWGIRVSGPALETLVVFLSNRTGASVGHLRRTALEQVLRHEWAHFAIEVLAFELELRLRRMFYPGYVRHRYGHSALLPGPVEEAIASYREVAFARGRLALRLRPKPAGYLRAVKDLLALSGDGYMHWALMDRATDRARLLKDHLGLIVGRPSLPSLDRRLVRLSLGLPTPAERDQVPLTWLGDPSLISAYGGVPKNAAPPTIQRFERWLRDIGAVVNVAGGRGSHRKARLPNGRTVTYAAGHGILLRPEAKQIARLLGLTLADFQLHVAELRVPAALQP